METTIKRTSHFSWCPTPGLNYLACGTAAGALDESFSSSTDLEIFNIDFNKTNAKELNTTAKISTESRFNRLSWSRKTEKHELGVIAGGSESGLLTIWDANKLYNSEEGCVLMNNNDHKGQIKGLEFHPNQTNLLASGANEGEIYIWNLQELSKPYTPGPKSQKLGDVTDISWNNNVQHILASSSSNGTTSVWDLKNKREVMGLAYTANNIKYGASSVTWHPQMATKLITSSDSDESPGILVWDLRNANSPLNILKGHEKGVLSVQWCKFDDNLLLSCGKDNRTICWNPNTCEIVKEFETKSNWVFDVQFNSNNPNLVTTASFDGTISIYSLLSGTDPKEQLKNEIDSIFEPNITKKPNGIIKQPPKWLKRPIVAKYGFNGKFVTFSQPNKQKITIYITNTQNMLAKQARELEESLNTNGAKEFCAKKIQNNQDETKDNDWILLKLLFEKDARKQLIKYLKIDTEVDFKDNDIKVEDESTEELMKNKDNPTESDVAKDEIPEPETKGLGIETKDETSEETNRLSKFFNADASQDQVDDFFLNPEKYAGKDLDAVQETNEATDLTELVKGKATPSISPFSIDANINTINGKLAMAVITGNFTQAVELCLTKERYSDALILATCGGSKLVSSTQKKIFKTMREESTYIRLIENVIDDNLMDVVVNADLAEWDKILVMICTYAQGDEFGDLCEHLAKRLCLYKGDNQQQLNKYGLVCYLASGNIDMAIKIWIKQAYSCIETRKKTNNKDMHKYYNEKLHEIVEKITLFSKAIDYADPSFSDHNNQSEETASKESQVLYDIYYEYALQLAYQGQTDIAFRYIDKVPATYNNENTKEVILILRDRLYKSSSSLNKEAYSFPIKKYFIVKAPASNQQTPYQQQHTIQQPITSNAQSYHQQPPVQNPQYNNQSNNFTNYDSKYVQRAPMKPAPEQSSVLNSGWNDPPTTAFSRKNILNNQPNIKDAIYSPFPNQPNVNPYTSPSPNDKPNFQQYSANPSISSRPPPTRVMPPPKESKVPSPMFSQNKVQGRPQAQGVLPNRILAQPPQKPFSPQQNSNGIRPQLSNAQDMRPPSLMHPQRPANPHQIPNPRPSPVPINQRPLPPNMMQKPAQPPRPAGTPYPRQQMPQPNMQQRPFQNENNYNRPVPNPHQMPQQQYRPQQTTNQMRPLNTRPMALPHQNIAPSSPVNTQRPPSVSMSKQSSNQSVDKSKISPKFIDICRVFDKKVHILKSHPSATQNSRLISDIEKKLNMLYDLMANSEANIKPEVGSALVDISKNLEINEYIKAKQIYQQTIQDNFNTIGAWATGVKNLIQLCEKISV